MYDVQTTPVRSTGNKVMFFVRTEDDRRRQMSDMGYGGSLPLDDVSFVWPERFHRLIPLKMAELYYAIDAGEKSRACPDAAREGKHSSFVLLIAMRTSA
jgi:hypothetical protein